MESSFIVMGNKECALNMESAIAIIKSLARVDKTITSETVRQVESGL